MEFHQSGTWKSARSMEFHRCGTWEIRQINEIPSVCTWKVNHQIKSSERAEQTAQRYWAARSPSGWCILSRTTAIPHMVHQEYAPVYYPCVILLILNILTPATEVMSVIKLGKRCDGMYMALSIVKKKKIILSFVSIWWKILVNLFKQFRKCSELTCLIKNGKMFSFWKYLASNLW